MKSMKSMHGFAMSGILWLIIGAALLYWGYTQNWAGLALVAGIVGALLLLHGLYKLFAPEHVEDTSAAAGSGSASASSGASQVAAAGTAAAGAAAAAVASDPSGSASSSAAGNAAGSSASAASGAAAGGAVGVGAGYSRMASLTEMRRFKETVTVLLVSSLFIMLTASLDMNALSELGWGTLAFVILILFVVRPIAIFIATTGAGLNFKERVLVAWIAPRGIVAVAVSGLFGTALADLGVADGSQLTALTFAVVASTILLHGFSLGPLASALGLKSAERPGVLIVGGSTWADGFAAALKDAELPVLIADSNWDRIRDARLADTPVYFGEVLSEAAHHDIVVNRYSQIVAATDNDAYNSLVCTELAPEFGRSHVFQIGHADEDSHRRSYSFTVGGRPLFKPRRDLSELRADIWRGSVFQNTRISEEFTFSDYLESRAEDTTVICWVKPNGTLVFRTGSPDAEPAAGDTLIAFGPPPKSGKTATNEKADTI